MSRPAPYWVVHVDLDAFLAAAEVLRRPELAGLPVVVGGSGDPTRRGVVATASYEARAFGVTSGTPLRTAVKRCPDAVFLPADNAYYDELSETVMDVLRTVAPEEVTAVEVMGWDEAFLGGRTTDPEGLARAVKGAVLAGTGLRCTVGIGDDLLRAKIATEFGKPAGTACLTAATWFDVMGERPTEALWGIGRKTAAKLAELGVHTVRELAGADPDVLAARLGPVTGPALVHLGRGISRIEVRGTPWVARTTGHELTFQHDLAEWSLVRSEVDGAARTVAAAVAADGRPAARVGVKVRFVPFTTRTRSTALDEPTSDPDAIAAAALAALERLRPGRGDGVAGSTRAVRLVGVRAEFASPPVTGIKSGIG